MCGWGEVAASEALGGLAPAEEEQARRGCGWRFLSPLLSPFLLRSLSLQGDGIFERQSVRKLLSVYKTNVNHQERGFY